MTLRMSQPRAGRRWLGSLFIVAAASVLTAGAVLATLAPSTFNAADGNLITEGATDKDWSNAPNRQVGIDLPTGQQDDSFGNGTKEDTAVPSVIDGSIPNNKSDLTRFYVANEKVSGKDFLYLAWERVQEPSGTTNMDFEFNQSSTISANGVTPVRTAGDLLIKYDLSQGGTNPVLGYHRWVTTGNAATVCEANNTVPCWGKVQNLAGNFEGAINTAIVSDPVPPNAPRSLSVRTFGEAAINLTDSGIFPAGQCSSFGSGYLKSRSSDSFTAAVKDFVAPVSVRISNCGTIIINKAVQNAPAGDPTTFSYTTGTGLSPNSFSLAGGGSRTYANVQAGSYTVTEGAQSAPWNFVSLSCTASSGSSGAQNGQAANISLAAQGTVECTFTNHYTNSPTLNTQVKNNADNSNIANNGHVAIGTVAYDTATFSNASNPTGNVQYYVEKGDATCTVDAVNTVDLGSKAIGTASNTTTFATAGTYYFWAVYGGDANNNAATSACNSEVVIVDRNQSTIGTAQDLIPNDTATIGGVTAAAGGSVTFNLYAPNDPLCNGTPAYTQTVSVSGGGTYSTTNSTFHATAEGTWRWLVTYSGDANNIGSTSACGVEQFSIDNDSTN